MSDDDKDWFLQLPNNRKQIFLARLSWDLTIHGRWFCSESIGAELLRAFGGLNELQHQISQHIAHLGVGDERYPDDVLWDILNEKAAMHGLSNHLKGSLKIARSKTNG